MMLQKINNDSEYGDKMLGLFKCGAIGIQYKIGTQNVDVKQSE